ncbi:MAG: hypothetical protein PHU06_11735 [Gallionella sp.]|nr:hypothetical protein [Gallionella sp.]MDD4959238.1 hypothetical protein [Gallionella sp.]
MVAFALVTEGITDQAVLENILYCWFDDVEINPLNPLRDATDTHRAASFSNWEKVLEYCQQDEFKASLQFNEFVIVQIDTDTAEHPNFNVTLTNQGVERAPIEIIADVKQLIVQKIGNDFYQQYHAQILIAVAVGSTECWLLPLHSKDHHKTDNKVFSCDKKLKGLLALRKGTPNSEKNHKNYFELSKDFRKRKTLLDAAKRNESLDDFVTQLQTITMPT